MSPYSLGKTSINGFSWELNQIAKYIKTKNMPVFITETGWKRNTEEKDGLTEDQISKYYKIAFEKIWNDQRIVAVAPFVFNYPNDLFHQFSFKTSGEDSPKTYYDYFFTIRDLAKVKGEPERENLVSGLEIKKPDHVLEKSTSEISLKFKNIGNNILHPNENLKIKLLSDQVKLLDLTFDSQEIYPGQSTQITMKIRINDHGTFSAILQIVDENKIMAQNELEIISETSFQYLYHGLKSFLKHIPI